MRIVNTIYESKLKLSTRNKFEDGQMDRQMDSLNPKLYFVILPLWDGILSIYNYASKPFESLRTRVGHPTCKKISWRCYEVGTPKVFSDSVGQP